jgi:hypothetical protein
MLSVKSEVSGSYKDTSEDRRSPLTFTVTLPLLGLSMAMASRASCTPIEDRISDANTPSLQ